MGSTFTAYEDVKQMFRLLDDLQERYWPRHPIDVEAPRRLRRAAPPDLEWDFRVPREQSINVSGTSTGRCTGVGGYRRDAAAVPRTSSSG